MAHHPMPLRHVSSLLAVACLVLGCEGDTGCGLAGCPDTLSERLEVVSDAPNAELTFEACFNDHCQSDRVREESIGWYVLEPVKGQLMVGGNLYVEDGVRRVSVSWNAVSSLDVKAGDRYAVRLKAADGTTVAESVQIAESYSRSYPNGKECDGDGCLHVASSRRP